MINVNLDISLYDYINSLLLSRLNLSNQSTTATNVIGSTSKMTAISSSAMAAVFPISCITPTTGVPTRVYLTQNQKEINSNAMIIASTTHPTYGHLVLVVTPAIYTADGANPFDEPANPGLNPTIIENSTVIVINESNRRHLIVQTHYDTYHTADKALSKQLLEAIPSVYLKAIIYDTLGFGQTIFLHIMNNI